MCSQSAFLLRVVRAVRVVRVVSDRMVRVVRVVRMVRVVRYNILKWQSVSDSVTKGRYRAAQAAKNTTNKQM